MAPTDYVSDYEAVTGKPPATDAAEPETKVITPDTQGVETGE